MMKLSLLCLFKILSLTILTSLLTMAQPKEWGSPDPAHLEMKTPMVDKNADAEVLLWEVYINDSSRYVTTYTHFLRIKIFTDRGKETQSRIDIPYLDINSVSEIAGRTIKPDGSVVELRKESIFDREIVKYQKLKVRAKSFAMPGIETGSIIEYRWREARPESPYYVKLELQREIPVQTVRYYLKPFANTYPMRTITFTLQGNRTPFAKNKEGYFVTEMTSIPALIEEPYAPPEDEIRSWMLVFYAPIINKEPAVYWKEEGNRLFNLYRDEFKVNNNVRKVAVETIGDASTPEQKLERLFNFCQTKVKNINDDASGLKAMELEKLKPNRSPADTLKRGYGTGSDINFLFGALAIAAGFEARFVNIADRGSKFFDQSFLDDYFLKSTNIAVRVADQWRFFDPASTYVPFGMLRWQEEGLPGLISQPKESSLVTTPITPAEKSGIRRFAKLQLLEDGTLQGEVRIEYSGHFAVEMKEVNDQDSVEQREKRLLKSVTERLSTAEFAAINIDSPSDSSRPFVYSYKVRVQGYAERTGKRLFLQPAFFQKGYPAMFTASERRTDIYFHFPWLEQDHITIDLPAGYVLDNANQPGPIEFGAHIGAYQLSLGITKDQQTLDFKRNFQFHQLLFKKENYPFLKQVFDAIKESDSHIISLKQGGPVPDRR